ncbi:hypothetical protein PV729_46705 [Streptomyces europaeiscabiei]|uniref:Uncharacterized protein n=1 Tax=Streptomyces europaeiscabiei TaxID=146819 RepID=A0ABU4N982_9ACTN|nr:hypothetical protein [Streptomyces europaeiscabiei]MDX3559058.1 hypothetical protein [Streptomyces europaeiscabiei]MDX3699633.1 hypothetical protein [Streptomyces europaeiscabiei]
MKLHYDMPPLRQHEGAIHEVLVNVETEDVQHGQGAVDLTGVLGAIAKLFRIAD